MGIFFAILFAALTLYLIYIGLHRGAFPVLVALAVTSLAFMVAIDFAPQMAHRLAGTLSNWSPDDLLAISYSGLFAVFFLLFGFLALRFGPEIAPMHPSLDKVFGVVLGALAGIAISGSLSAGIFSFTRMQAFRERHGATDQQLYIKPHVYMMDAYGFVAKRMAGRRPFNPDTALAGVGLEAPAMPFAGNGFWIGSVPPGRRVFISTIPGIPGADFKRNLSGWVEQDWSRGPIQHGRERMGGYVGNSPLFVPTAARDAWVGVEMPLPPGASADTPALFHDDQRDIFTYSRDGRNYAVKMYQLRKQHGQRDEVVSMIVLLLPQNPTERDIENAMPAGSAPFSIRPEAEGELRGLGLATDKVNFVMDMARRGGKVP